MKFGVRKPSVRGRISARISIKRLVRHSFGLKAPRGAGWITNPKKALYNRVYNRTSISVDRLLKPKPPGRSKSPRGPKPPRPLPAPEDQPVPIGEALRGPSSPSVRREEGLMYYRCGACGSLVADAPTSIPNAICPSCGARVEAVLTNDIDAIPGAVKGRTPAWIAAAVAIGVVALCLIAVLVIFA